jgi:SOS-response transcriptional repressor LexA
MDKKAAVLRMIVAFKRAHDGNSPTYREIMRACELRSTSAVAYHLDALEDQGLIRRPNRQGNTRVIEVPGGRWTPPERGRHDVQA